MISAPAEHVNSVYKVPVKALMVLQCVSAHHWHISVLLEWAEMHILTHVFNKIVIFEQLSHHISAQVHCGIAFFGPKVLDSKKALKTGPKCNLQRIHISKSFSCNLVSNFFGKVAVPEIWGKYWPSCFKAWLFKILSLESPDSGELLDTLNVAKK